MSTRTEKKSPATAARHGSGVLRYPAVVEMVGLSRPQVWRLVRAGRFPAPIQLGPNSVGFLVTEVDAWLAERTSPAARVAAAAERTARFNGRLARPAAGSKRRAPR